MHNHKVQRMKLFYVLILILIFSESTFAQPDNNRFNEDIINMSFELQKLNLKFDEANNAVHYNMFFYDAESFKVYTHFNSTETLFDKKLIEFNSSGVLDRIIALGIGEIVFSIKSESTGEVLYTENLKLQGFEAKVDPSYKIGPVTNVIVNASY